MTNAPIRTKSLAGSAATLLWALLLAAPAAAGPFPEDVVPVAELERLRGGFTLGGLQVELGANVRTFADDRLVMETVVNVTDTGLRTQRATFAEGVTALTPASLADLNLQGLGDASGVSLDGAGGLTAAIHQVTRERILGVLITQGHNQNLRHELDVNVTVRNFSQFQDAVRGALLNSRIGRALGPGS